MNALMNHSAPLTMSSTDLLDLINKERESFGEPIVRRNDFHARVEDELDGDYYETFVVQNANGTSSVVFYLTLKQCMYVAMRESKGVRRKVQEILEEKQKPSIALPDFTNPAEAARAWALEFEEKQKAQAALAIAAPKVEFFDKVVDRKNLMTATQVGQKVGLSAIKLNQALDAFSVFNNGVKRGRVFQQWFVDKGYGELKQTELGYSQPLFTTAGEAWIVEKLTGEGVI